MQLDATPMGARVALAMARIVAPFDPARAAKYRNMAELLATEVALQVSGDLPLLFAGEGDLERAFWQARRDAATQARAAARTVWTGPWCIDKGGEHAARACVAQSRDGFMPGLEVARLCRDAAPAYGPAVATREEAIALALGREALWHVAAGPNRSGARVAAAWDPAQSAPPADYRSEGDRDVQS
jgi:hypothetical protein